MRRERGPRYGEAELKNLQETRRGGGRGDLSQGNRFPAKDACLCARGKANVFRKGRSQGTRCPWKRLQRMLLRGWNLLPRCHPPLGTPQLPTKLSGPPPTPSFFEHSAAAEKTSTFSSASRNKIIPRECKSTSRRAQSPADGKPADKKRERALFHPCPRLFTSSAASPRFRKYTARTYDDYAPSEATEKASLIAR